MQMRSFAPAGALVGAGSLPRRRRWLSGKYGVDRSKTLAEEPGTGHNRWHPDIAPVLHCEAGDEVVLETRDAFDGQMGTDASLETVASPNLDVVHALTGPVYVEGAEPGDMLEVEIRWHGIRAEATSGLLTGELPC
jgi:hypothetical protein